MESLKRIRKEKGLTQVELSRLANVRQDSLSRYERGEQSPRWETIQRLCRALGITPNDLMETDLPSSA